MKLKYWIFWTFLAKIWVFLIFSDLAKIGSHSKKAVNIFGDKNQILESFLTEAQRNISNSTRSAKFLKTLSDEAFYVN
jgi:branched-subunit amino acid permease